MGQQQMTFVLWYQDKLEYKVDAIEQQEIV